MGALGGMAALTVLAWQAQPAVMPTAPAPVETPVIAQPSPVDEAPIEPDTTDAGTTADKAEGEAPAIIVTAKPKYDPLSGVNTAAFNFTQDVDDKLVAPLANAYKTALPKPARAGLHNFIRNIGSPIVFINDLLQLKPGRALKTLGRFAINTTIGVGGLIDVAKDKPFHLPYRPNGFANTLGYYGIKPGPYLFLPFIGPTSLRDMIGGAVDGVVLPYGIGAPFNKAYYTLPNGAIRSLDRRVEFDCQLQAIRKSEDPYAAHRTYYLRKRQAEIDALRGRPVEPLPVAQCETTAAEPANPAAEPVPPPVSPTGQEVEAPPSH